MMSVTFHNVHKTLKQKEKKTRVFECAQVSFSADHVSGILAPPRSGKTTAVQLTTGRLYPDRGRVHRSSLVSFPVGSAGVFSGLLSARDNLAFLCRVFGFDPRPIIRFVLDFTELNAKVLDKPFRLCNRDERTRILFASCYAIPFDFYVVDETLIGGRGSFRDRCEELVRERMRTAGFLIFSSSPRVLKKFCNSHFIIDQMGMHPVESVDAAVARIGEAQLRDGDGYTDAAAEADSSEMSLG